MSAAQQVTIVRQPARRGAALRSSDAELSFHATIRETEASTGSVTQYPVEASADSPREEIATGYTNHPRTITLEVIQSDTPIDADVSTRAGLSDEARDTLERLKASATILSIVSGTRTIKNMVILDWQAARDNATGQSFRPTIRLQQARFVSSQIVAVPLVGDLDPSRTLDNISERNGARDSASGDADSGRQSASEAGEDTEGALPPLVRTLRLAGVNL